MFERLAAVQLVHVPYKGSAPALTDLLGGQVQIMFDASSVAAYPCEQADRAGGDFVKRTPLLAQVPTMQEAGLAGYEVISWYALYAPAKTPPAVAQRLNAEVRKIMEQPSIAQRLHELGFQPATGTAAELGTFMREEIAKWARVIEQAKVTIE
ncbi:MAG: hypothetical protein KIS79_09475 [Burkholderiales bacterium]|nr:hypothetical protein [Burkholderiales bacterium]